ncbi:carboxypeptidase C [Xylariaceae sp. FL0255]|nr:carboxypeptidase C [Xylariaceae sp. FL0255]
MLRDIIFCVFIAGVAIAQFPPKRFGITVLQSKFHENVSISFKEPGICETTPGVKSYSGYVHLPPRFLDDGPDGEAQDYPINTFFWFFEARNNAANAPGSSIMGLLEENGSCFIGADSKSTYLNPWSWNNEVNMLYIDQPTQVGFSYDVLTNATATLMEGSGGFSIVPSDFSDGVPQTNMTYHVVTFGSQKVGRTANSTAHAAHAFWHFAQTWFAEFPHYKPADNRISLWVQAESYGGHYGPGFFHFLQQRNNEISRGDSIEKDAHYLHPDTLGIIDGLIDEIVQHESFISFPFNNTYGIQVFNESLYEDLMYNWTRPNACKDKVQACQDSMNYAQSRPLGSSGSNKREGRSAPCDLAADDCAMYDWDVYQSLDPFPPPHMHGYLMQESTLAALGVPVNHSAHSFATSRGFDGTYDFIHGGYLDAIAHLLDRGDVKVHLVYGDRDYACNWVGGEAASLAIPWTRSAKFAAAAYAPLMTPNDPAITAAATEFSGMTRQFGNFSFTRVFQAGLEVPSYTPAAAHAIFTRALFNCDIATGLSSVTDELATIGPRSTWHVHNTPPEMPEPKCYILKPSTCLPEVWETVVDGTAIVEDWFFVGKKAPPVEVIGEL